MSARSLAWRRGSSALRRSCARAPRTPPGRLRPTRRASLLGRGVERAPASRVPSPVTKERLASSWPNRSWMRIVDHWPERCSGCGQDLDRSDHAAPPHRHQVTELPPIAVRVTEHRAHSLRCPGCGTSTRASLPEEIRQSAFGPRLQAAVSLLSVRNRISRRDASELCGELFGCEVSAGSVDAICQRTSGALAEPYAGLREAVKDSPVICVDETGWRCAGQKRTLWGAITDSLAAFHIAADRHERELPGLIGESFAGIVSSDRWWAYDSLDPARRQVCWAHLLRDFRRHSEGLADQGRFGEAGLEMSQGALPCLGFLRRPRRSRSSRPRDCTDQAPPAGSA